MSSTEEQVLEFGQRWAAAEQRGDVTALDAMATDDFTLVGPYGFLLDKDQWLHRYRSGALVTQELSWHEVTVRGYGDTAVAIGIHAQRAAHQGRQNDGRFRATHVLVRTAADGWRLASVHLSPIAAPPTSS